MFTIFSCPKPFVGHIKTIQENALESWVNLGVEVILFGNDKGVREVAVEFGVIHYPDISTNEYGTPYLPELFAMATDAANNPILWYTNADIIFLDKPPKSIGNETERGFLCVGERWDCAVTERTDTSRTEFRTWAEQNHTTLVYPGLDYFIFPKGMIRKMPPFVIGRAGWDNWLVYNTMKRHIPVINCTERICAVHQNHDYGHVPERTGNTWKGNPESKTNLALINNRSMYLWGLWDSDYRMDREGNIHKEANFVRWLSHTTILGMPEPLHSVIDPFYRLGHIANIIYHYGQPTNREQIWDIEISPGIIKIMARCVVVCTILIVLYKWLW